MLNIMYSGGHRGFSLKRRPKRYSILPQQRKFLDALKFCGIKRGISKSELMERMKNCIPEFYKEHKDDDKGLHGEALQTMQRD